MRRTTAIGLGVSALLAMSACGGGGGEGGAPHSPALAEPQASEAVAAAVLSVASVLVELATDPPAVDIGVTGTSEVATALTLCPGGGSLSGTCVLRVHRDSILRISMRHCGLVDERSGLRSVVDGRLTVQAPYNFCDSGHVPVGGERTYRFDGFTAVLSDGDGVVETFAAERLVESMLPRNTGCEQDDAALDINGALEVQRRDGINIALRTAGLHLERSGAGPAGQCSRHIEASGRLTIDDHSSLHHVEVDLDALAVDVDGAGALRGVEGGLALDCVPAIVVAMDQALVPGVACPSAGVLALHRADGSRGLLTFADGGVSVDADADGTPERVASDCRDPALAQCPL
jgi:hypothetical protein